MERSTAKEMGFNNRIYAAEAEIRLTHKQSVPTKDIQKVIKKLQTSNRVKNVMLCKPHGWRLSRAASAIPIVNFGNGNGGGGFYSLRYCEITLHTFTKNNVQCFTHQTLIHELAHHVAYNRTGVFHDRAHGAGFVTALLELYRAVYGVQIHKEFKNACAAYGIKMINDQGKKVKVRSVKVANNTAQPDMCNA